MTIDIKPGEEPNSINLKSSGVVPVAILTTEDFNAKDVDPTTILFAGASPVRWSLSDVDRDRDKDLLCHFRIKDLNLTQSSTEARLKGQTYGEISFEGSDTVNIVPKKK